MATFDSSSEFSAAGGAFTIVSGGHEIFTIDNTGLFFVFAVTPITAAVDVGVTENGNAMTRRSNVDNVAGNFSVFIFERTGLAGTGFHTVTTTFVSGRDAFAGVGVSYTDVFAGRILRLGPVLNTNSAAPSVTMAPGVGEVAFAFLGVKNDTIAITEGPFQTTLRSATAGGAGGVRMHVAFEPGDVSTVLSEGLATAADLILLGQSVVDVGGGIVLASGALPGAGALTGSGNGTFLGSGTLIGAGEARGHGLVAATIEASGVLLGEAILSSIDAGTRSRSAAQLDAQLSDHANRIAMLERAVQRMTSRQHRVDGRV